MKLNDAVFGVLLLVLGVTILFVVQAFPKIPGQQVGPALFPGLIAAGLCIGGLILLATWAAATSRPSSTITRLSWILLVIFVLQLVVGALNVVWKAPVAMQLVHLLISDMIWIALILLAANALAVKASLPIAEDSPSHPASLAGRTV